MREDYPLVIETLQPVKEHRPVRLREYVRTDHDSVVRCNADEIRIKRGMMQFAQSDAIVDDRYPLRVRIRNDMRRVQKLTMFQPAASTLLAVRLKHALSKALLMKSLPG
jgi:hypothetical protein